HTRFSRDWSSDVCSSDLLFFAKQSLRTWVACDIAAIQLGAHPLSIRDDNTGMGTRETPGDVGRVLERYLDLLALRVHRHSDLVRSEERRVGKECRSRLPG